MYYLIVHLSSREPAAPRCTDRRGAHTQTSITDDDVRELTDRDFARAIPRKQRERILSGRGADREDIVALRRFVGLTQLQFAEALGISVHTLRNWEQGRRRPEGPALALFTRSLFTARPRRLFLPCFRRFRGS